MKKMDNNNKYQQNYNVYVDSNRNNITDYSIMPSLNNLNHKNNMNTTFNSNKRFNNNMN
jgi:hypothetical protein